MTGLRSPDLARLHRVNRGHLDAMTGELGIFQHARGSEPDPGHGYCVDDVARALEVDLLHARVLTWPVVAGTAERSLAFLEAAFDSETRRFRNFRAVDGSWQDGPASNDSSGRAMLALGQFVHDAPEPGLAQRARSLFNAALPKAARMTSPRAQAAVVLACLAATSGPAAAATAAETAAALPAQSATRRPIAAKELEATVVARTLATDLHARVQSFARPAWPWPEPALTYENALIPRALILAGQEFNARAMLAVGLRVLDWLIEVQTAADGHCSPIGNGWWERGGMKSRFDQQPIEPTALLLAAEAAFAVTGDPRYTLTMERAYAWFLGRNDLGVAMAVPARGACRDGLTPKGANANEGAESTLMWLIALEHIRALRTSLLEPAAVAARGPEQHDAILRRPRTSLISTAGS
jgi:hypothetical protein